MQCPRPVAEINQALLERGIIGGFDLARFDPRLARHMLVCATETNSREEIDGLIAGLEAARDE